MSPKSKCPQSRRDFLKTAALLTGAVALDKSFATESAAAEQARIPVGSNIYGWGQYYSRMHKDVNANLDEVLSALRDCGCGYLEGYVDVEHPENNVRFAERLRAKGLQPVCLYTGAHLHEAGKVDEVIHKLVVAAKSCHEAGFTIIDCNPDPIGREKTAEELQVQANSLNQLGAGFEQHGIRLAVHNHTPAMANHAREFHDNFDQTNPELVGFCYDVHWVFRGGLAPADCLREYGSRIANWHLRQSRDRVWWEDLDTGDVDYEAIAAYARRHEMRAPYTIELALEPGTKITRSVVENHRRSRDFVRKVFGV